LASEHGLQLQRFGFAESLIRDFAFVPSGREVLATDAEGTITRWTLPSLRPAGSLKALGSNNFLLASCPKLGLLATIDRQDVLKVWSFDRQMLVTNLALAPGAGRVAWLGFAPAGRRLVGLFNITNVVQWDTSSWQSVSGWSSTNLEFGPISVSPDARFLAAGGSRLTVYALQDGRILASIPAHKGFTDTVAFSPDGKLLATGSQEGLAKLWSTDSWQELGTLRGHLQGVHGLAFSADGRRLATGSSGNEAVKLWDLATQQEVLNLASPADLAFCLSFSPDGRSLLSLGPSSDLKCWFAPLLSELGL
jgi:WD40 repeat protein